MITIILTREEIMALEQLIDGALRHGGYAALDGAVHFRRKLLAAVNGERAASAPEAQPPMSPPPAAPNGAVAPSQS